MVGLNEHGGHGGTVSAPAAFELIKVYFRIKAEEAAARGAPQTPDKPPPPSSPSPSKDEPKISPPPHPREARAAPPEALWPS